MPAWLWLLLSLALAGIAGTLYFRHAVRNEASRKRLLPLLRPIMRVMNPRVMRAVERQESPFGVLHHIGRRSGTAYHTPVGVGRTPDGVLIPLMYGPGTDWCRNILAAGHCTLTFEGGELALTAPEVVLPGVGEPQLTAETLREWRGDGIAHYLSLKSAPQEHRHQGRDG